MKAFILYYRTSTKSQDYGIQAQMAAVQQYLKTVPHPFTVLAEYEERESGANDDRPKLKQALELAQRQGATLIIAKLCRLSRNAAFLLTLQNSGVEFICCDMPHADKFTIGILALVAQKEREMISLRTREGLAIAARTKKLGNPRFHDAIKAAHTSIQSRKGAFNQTILVTIKEIREKAKIQSLDGIADVLNRRGYVGRRGGAWTATAVKRVMAGA